MWGRARSYSQKDQAADEPPETSRTAPSDYYFHVDPSYNRLINHRFLVALLPRGLLFSAKSLSVAARNPGVHTVILNGHTFGSSGQMFGAE
jgi:hypothetical protein